METLINLLNEFDSGTVGLTEDLLRETGCTYCIICKPYGFIKWLVDNDKIDREGMKGHGRLISYCLYIKSWQWDKIKEGVLLMLLSISDTPIGDLISYLK